VGATLHRPVLLTEVLMGLAVRPEGVYVDATYGRGGHAAAILEQLGPRGRLWAMDRDPEAVADARVRCGSDGRFQIIKASFAMLERVAQEQGFMGRAAGLLLDLGVSSPQLDDPARGFSFQADGPLDMRMDTESGESAVEWLARAPEAEIARVLDEYGEERHARRIARALVAARREAPIMTTGQLAEIIARATPRRDPRKHPATRSFQAIRIHINQELETLAAMLPQACALLAPGGRLAVISFHSLEDRIVKRFMRDASEPPPTDPRLPPPVFVPTLRRIGRAQRATDAECAANPRARSAVLRVAERLS
jgi:16S rRNA (cytosine1402-N4)-methyltransferase